MQEHDYSSLSELVDYSPWEPAGGLGGKSHQGPDYCSLSDLGPLDRSPWEPGFADGPGCRSNQKHGPELVTSFTLNFDGAFLARVREGATTLKMSAFRIFPNHV